MALQEKISHLGQDLVPELLGALMDKYCPPQLHHAIRKVEFDLGVIPYHNFEAGFLERLREKAEEFFKDQLAFLTLPENAVKDEERQAAAFFFFMTRGQFPWWSVTEGAGDPSSMLDKILVNAKDAWIRFLHAEGRSAEVRERLVFQFAEYQLVATLHLLEPSNAGIILRYSESLDEVHARKPVVTDPVQSFRKVKWLFIFQYLLSEKSSYFEAKTFLKSLIRRIAAHYGLDYFRLLHDLYQAAAQVYIPSGNHPLPAVIKDIFVEEVPAATQAAAGPDATASAKEQEYQAVLYLEHFLLYGSMPVSIRNYNRGQFEKLLAQSLHTYPEETASLIREHGVQQKIRDRMVRNFSESFLETIVILLEPAYTDTIKDTAEAWTGLRSERKEISVSESEFTRVKWEIILAYLLVEKGSRFNRKSFLRYLVTRTAAHYNIAYTELLQSLLLVFRMHQYTGDAALPQLLKEIAEEDKTYGKKDREIRPDLLTRAGLTETDEDHPRTKLDILIYYLEHGRLPWWAKSYSHHRIPSIFREILQSVPGALIAAMKELAGNEEAALRMTEIIDEQTYLLLYAHSAIPLHKETASLYPRVQQELRKHSSGEPVVFREFVSYLFFYGLSVTVPDIRHLRNFMSRLSARHGTDAEELIVRLAAILDRGRLANIVQLLAEELGVISGVKQQLSPEKEKVPAEQVAKNAPAEESSAQPADVEALEQFLLTGFLPSWARYLETYDFKRLFEYVWKRHPAAFRLMAVRILKVPVLRKLLFEKLDAPVLYRLSGFLFPGSFPVFSSFSKDSYHFMEVQLPGMSHAQRAALFWEYAFVFLSGRQNFVSTEFAVGLWDLVLSNHPAGYSAEAFQAAEDKMAAFSGSFSPLFRAAIQHELERIREDDVIVHKAAPENKPVSSVQKENEKEDVEAEKNIYIHNAGLVIVFPFLQQLFERLELMKEGVFISAAAAYRAVHILQYVVTGETGHPEYHLALNKLLCGVAGSRPLERNVEVSDDEKAVCDGMLSAIIQQWTIVNNSSIEAIRESFLQRGGRITAGDDAWRLVVEKKGIDVLMDHLPWPISVIRLPWMEKPLYVTWR